MSIPIGDELKVFAGKILDEIQSTAGDAWLAWSPEDRALALRCAQRAARIAVLSAAGQDMAQERADVTAQMANLSSAAAGSLNEGIWDIVGRLLRLGASTLL